jgi:hypothetical protein
MVWGMGLLDDAIREHLELKRLHGGSASEVILEERDALGPSRGGNDRTPAERMASPKEPLHACDNDLLDGKASMDLGPPHLSQETVELDMRSVLDAESNENGGHERVRRQAL